MIQKKFHFNLGMNWLTSYWHCQEEPHAGGKCLLGLAGRPHGDYLGSLLSLPGPIMFYPTSYGLMDFWSFKMIDNWKMCDLSYHQFLGADLLIEILVYDK